MAIDLVALSLFHALLSLFSLYGTVQYSTLMVSRVFFCSPLCLLLESKMTLVHLVAAATSSFVARPMLSSPRTSWQDTASSITMREELDDMELEEWASKIRDNLFEGSFGSRGEAWVVGQALMVGGVAAAPEIPGILPLSILLGLVSLAAGFLLAAAAAYSLGPSLTPWPKPVQESRLKTEGVYSLCRHPIYTGLILGCGGVALLSQSFERLLLTCALIALLSSKAAREEEFLEDKFGDVYKAYAKYVPRLIPVPSKLLQWLQQLHASES